jgi:Icc-related predicted phosphoesterase
VEDSRIRIAAAGDIHVTAANRAAVSSSLDQVEREADLVLLAGDLTSFGEPEEGRVLAEICRGRRIPIIAVLGNHDWHVNRAAELIAVLETGGIAVLDRSWCVKEVRGTAVGIVGTKGFVGGFPDARLPDFGEPLLRTIYAETTKEVDALEQGLQAVAACPLRIVLLHYSPTTTTLRGEPPSIWAFLGSERRAVPIERHRPDLVLHGHGHRGTFAGDVVGVPVYNIALPVMGRDFWIFELEGGMGAPEEQPEIHVEAAAER